MTFAELFAALVMWSMVRTVATATIHTFNTWAMNRRIEMGQAPRPDAGGAALRRIEGEIYTAAELCEIADRHGKRIEDLEDRLELLAEAPKERT